MCSVQYLREFIKERLTAACEEIFSEVQKTVVHYEEEINRQRRLLEISRQHDTNSHITEIPQLHDCDEEEGLDEQQVCNQERNSGLDQEDPEAPQIKEEQGELCSSQEEEQLGLKQEAEDHWSDEERLRLLETIWNPEIKSDRLDLQQQHVGVVEEVLPEEKRNCLDQEDPEPPQIKEEQEELYSSQRGEQLGLKQEAETFMVTLTYEESGHSEPESNSEQFLSSSSPPAESRDQEESQHVDSGSTRNAEQKKRRLNRKRSHSDGVDNTSLSESLSQPDTLNKSFKCGTCGKMFHKKSTLTRHLSVHTGFKPYPCSTCGKTFTQKSNLERHVRIHTGEKPFSCSACGKRFNQKSDLGFHVRTHTGEKLYPCSTCEKRFNRKSILEHHKRSHTDHHQQHVGVEEEVLPEEKRNCLDQEDPEPPQIKEEQEELCSSQKGEQLGLKQEAFIVTPTYKQNGHSKPESNSEQFLSPSSPPAESRDQEESQHVDSGSTRNAEQKKRRLNRKRSHNDRIGNTSLSESQSQRDTRKKSVQCDTCGKTFHKKSTLTRHLSVHTGFKPYPCSTCGKTFNQKSNLERHVRTHTGEKPFSCSACGKRFNQKSDLELHVRTHTGEKPYPCSTCGKRLNRKSNLEHHKRIHTGEKPHTCSTCGKQFIQRTNLKTHMRIHKREKPYPRIRVNSY